MSPRMKSFCPTCRSFSSDESIWTEVYFLNQYNLPALSPSAVVVHLQKVGLWCVSEKINWNCLNDPAFYFGQVAFERGEKSAQYQTSLMDRLEWLEDGEVEVAIKTNKHRADTIK